MNRRKVLQILGTAIGSLPLMTRMTLSDAIAATANLRATGSRIPVTLTPQQDATVARLADIIIPATDTPGAREARVNEFVDVILTEWYRDEERDQFLSGLADVDRRATTAFQTNFIACSPEQQQRIVSELNDEHVSVIRARRTGGSRSPDDLFFHQLKVLTLTGYYTSEVGMKEELHYAPIPGEYNGCAPIERRAD